MAAQPPSLRSRWTPNSIDKRLANCRRECAGWMSRFGFGGSSAEPEDDRFGGVMRALVLPNFKVVPIAHDDVRIRDANKLVAKTGYWFYKYWKSFQVDVLDIGHNSLLTPLETR